MTRTHEAGFTIVELSIAFAIATVILGTIALVQSSAFDRFSNSVGEQRMTRSMREGMSEIKQELRGSLLDSVQVADPVAIAQSGDGTVILSFQTAISFDTATGQTQWGADEIAGGRVQYVLQGTDLVRRVLDDTGTVLVNRDVPVVTHLDRSGTNGPPVVPTFDPLQGFLGLTVRTLVMIDNEPVRREVQSIVHLEQVFNY